MPRQIIVDIIGDSSKYSKATGDAIKATVRMESTFGKLKSSIAQGLGVGAGLSVFNLATKGIGMVTDALGNAVQAAIEDEKAQAQLLQTVKANVPAWDGSTRAINDAITAGARLAFTDDDVRSGLNQLIPRTHDIAKANKLNALAMDLARAKNMSLEEAATLVGKAYSGQITALRRAGIAIKNTKDSSAALAELQASVSGQAENYAQTTEGSMQRADIAFSEAMESIGYAIKPVAAALAGFAADTLGLLTDQFDISNKSIDKGIQFINDYGKSVDELTPKVQKLADTQQANKLKEYTDAFDAWVSQAGPGLQQTALGLTALNGAAGQFDLEAWLSGVSRAFAMSTGQSPKAFTDLALKVAEAGGSLADFVSATQGLYIATNVDLKGIAQSYQRAFDPMTLSVEQFLVSWNKAAKDYMAGAMTMDQWNTYVANSADYLRAHFDKLPASMQEVARIYGIVGAKQTGTVSKYAEETINVLNTFWQRTVAGSAKVTEAVMSTASAVKVTTADMLRSVQDVMDPWKTAWQQAAAWAKDPFTPAKFAKKMGQWAQQAVTKAKEAAANGKAGAAARWRELARALRWAVKNNFTDPTKADIIKIIAALRTFSTLKASLGNAGKLGDNGPTAGRAAGGPVQSGKTYLVGERGPELVTMGASGFVTPNHALAGGGPSTTIVNNIHVSVAPGADSVEVGRQIVRHIQAFERRSGKVWRAA